jgi:uncharacterized protein
VLDASWTAERHRTAARSIAGRTVTDLFELQCSAPPDMTAVRMRRRLGAGGDPSDATPEIAAQMSLAQDPWPTAAVVDTSSDADETLDKALALLERGSHGTARPADPGRSALAADACPVA